MEGREGRKEREDGEEAADTAEQFVQGQLVLPYQALYTQVLWCSPCMHACTLRRRVLLCTRGVYISGLALYTCCFSSALAALRKLALRLSTRHHPLLRTYAATACEDALTKAKTQVQEFLCKHGFRVSGFDVNAPKRSALGLRCTYPLHIAAREGDLRMVARRCLGFVILFGEMLMLVDA